MKKVIFIFLMLAFGTALFAQDKKMDTAEIKTAKQSAYILTHKDSLKLAEAIKNYQPPSPDPIEDMLPFSSRAFSLPYFTDVIDVGHEIQ